MALSRRQCRSSLCTGSGGRCHETSVVAISTSTPTTTIEPTGCAPSADGRRVDSDARQHRGVLEEALQRDGAAAADRAVADVLQRRVDRHEEHAAANADRDEHGARGPCVVGEAEHEDAHAHRVGREPRAPQVRDRDEPRHDQRADDDAERQEQREIGDVARALRSASTTGAHATSNRRSTAADAQNSELPSIAKRAVAASNNVRMRPTNSRDARLGVRLRSGEPRQRRTSRCADAT